MAFFCCYIISRLQCKAIVISFSSPNRHYQLPDRGRDQRRRGGDDRRQPQQLQSDRVLSGGHAPLRPGEQGEARPVLRRRPDGRRVRGAGQQRLQALHLQV